MLHNFQFLKTRFTIQAIDELFLPEYKGSALRGGLGHLLKETCCDARGIPCKGCEKRDACLYSYLFETYCPKNSQFIRSFHEIPRPYILEPQLSKQRKYCPGDMLSFDLILFGRAIEFFPYFLVLFDSYGKELGIGYERGRFHIERITTVDISDEAKDTIYTSSTGLKGELLTNALLDFEKIRAWRSVHIPDTQEITLHFLTPFDIREEGHYVMHLDFEHFIKSLTRTISNLAYFHCNEVLDLDYRNFYQQASQEIQTKENCLVVTRLARYSRRQGKKIPISGLTGKIIFTGNMEHYLDYILLGQWTHVGRGRVMGLGKYSIFPK